LVSLYPELRLLSYAGVLLITSAAGLLVKQNYDRIGPIGIAVLIGLTAMGSLAWVVKNSPPFSWKETKSPAAVFDYVLMLGVLLAAADLAFIEVQFTPLGSAWPWHLLIVSLLMACAAVRFDSRAVFSLALSTFAAWRGVSVSLGGQALWWTKADSVRWNGIACGLIFIALASYLRRSGKKGHFQPVPLHLGWLLVLGALVSGGFEYASVFYSPRSSWGAAYIALSFVASSGLAWHSFNKRRAALFSFGVFGLYIAFFQLVLALSRDGIVIVFFAGAGAFVLAACLWKAHRRMKESL
jgi:hypothetical protein